MDKTKVLIADDNERTGKQLSEIVSGQDDMEVVGIASDGLEAIDMLKKKEPDVVLLDIIMPKLDGLGVMERVKNMDKRVKKPEFIVISSIGRDIVTENAF